MIVTIDGPAGAGKSTVARALARRLGFQYLDTGAMYRAVALAGLRRGIAWDEPDLLARLCRELAIEVDGPRILLDGEDVTDEVRLSAVTQVTRFAADNSAVREFLVELQRKIAGKNDIVTEGRDQGTAVFPDAECKIFLTASAEERARRRAAEMRERGEDVSFEQILAEQNQRDRRDASRAVGPLLPAADARFFSTDGLSIEEVVEQLQSIVSKRVR